MLWFKALHIISIIAWFSGLLYLPRLFICYYQWSDQPAQHYLSLMADKLYRYIINPAGLCSLIFGWCLIYTLPAYELHKFWVGVKLILAVCIVIYHLYLGTILRNLHSIKIRYNLKFYYFLYTIPILCCAVIILVTVAKPFE